MEQMQAVIAAATFINVLISTYVAMYVRAMRAELEAKILKASDERYALKEVCELSHSDLRRDLRRIEEAAG